MHATENASTLINTRITDLIDLKSASESEVWHPLILDHFGWSRAHFDWKNPYPAGKGLHGYGYGYSWIYLWVTHTHHYMAPQACCHQSATHEHDGDKLSHDHHWQQHHHHHLPSKQAGGLDPSSMCPHHHNCLPSLNEQEFLTTSHLSFRMVWFGDQC